MWWTVTCSLEIPLRSADRYLIKFTPEVEANNRASTGMANKRRNQKKLPTHCASHWHYTGHTWNHLPMWEINYDFTILCWCIRRRVELKSHLFPSEIVDAVWIAKWLVVLRSIIAKLRIDFEYLVYWTINLDGIWSSGWKEAWEGLLVAAGVSTSLVEVTFRVNLTLKVTSQLTIKIPSRYVIPGFQPFSIGR